MRRAALAAALLGLVCAGCASAAPRARAATPPVRHVFIIMLENKDFGDTFGDRSAAPYLSQTLPARGAFVPGYYGVTHESLGNYLALISGQGSNPQTQADCQIYTDFVPGVIGADGQALGTGCVFPSSVKTVADQLKAKGLTWKAYLEDMGNSTSEPKTCRHPALNSRDDTQSARQGDQYAARHNPFVYFHSIINSPGCARDDVPLDRLPADLRAARTTANYTFITPNLCHDAHDTPCKGSKEPGGMASANAFLRKWVPRITASPAYRRDGLLAVLFDESDTGAEACCGEPQFPNTPDNGGLENGPGGGHMGAVMLSRWIAGGTISHAQYNHFSFLASVEDFFGLPKLGYAGRPGLRTLGADVFTCYRLRGSLIQSVQVSRGAAKHPSLVLRLRSPARVRITVAGRRPGRARSYAGCQPATVRLPVAHGRATIMAAHGRSRARRVIVF